MQSWSGGGAGQAGVATSGGQSLTIQRRVDKGSPILAQACATGKLFVQMTVLSVSQGNTTMRAKLANVVITSYNTPGGSGAPMESMTLKYANGSFF